MPPATGTILIVDDDPNDVDLLRIAFTTLGNNNPVHVCADGDSTLDYLDGKGSYADRHKFPLPIVVILDWKLLGQSGLEVLKHIRKGHRMAKLCIVVLTASDYPQDREAALKAGADLYLLKPLGTFLSVVKTILDFWQHCESPQ